jgi:hypothetical protein
MLRGECCGHLDAWRAGGGGLAGGGLAHRLWCAATRPALALCVAERAFLPLELGDLVHGRRARGRRSRDEAAAPGGFVTRSPSSCWRDTSLNSTRAAVAISPRTAGATDSQVSPVQAARLALVALVLVAAGRSRVTSSRGRSGGFPVRTCPGRRTWRRAARPERPRAEGRGVARPPQRSAFPRRQSTALGAVPTSRHTVRRHPGFLVRLVPLRPRPPTAAGASPPLKP